MPIGVVVAGHLFSSSGMGEQARSGIRALGSVGISAAAYDIYRYARRDDEDMRSLVAPLEISELPTDTIRIFHINGDEVTPVRENLRDRGFSFDSGYNIIVPAWELPRYPAVWKEELAAFDEIWAISEFVKDSLAVAGLDAHMVGQAAEIDFRTYLPRRHFGIRESSFAWLCLLDTRSFVSRKNPVAVANLWRKFRKSRPFDDVQLILKLRCSDGAAVDPREMLGCDLPPDVVCLTEDLSCYGARSVIAACDGLISLHRAEGFGRGMAEAMLAGKIACATGWSGNCDFMSAANSLLVDYSLVDVPCGEYPHGDGQQWAEPDVDHALHLLLKAVDNPAWMRAVSTRGRCEAARTVANRPVGIRMQDRLKSICADRGGQGIR